jgi:5-hydroxyisourate hydrolase-like protein (transthyretin family)
MNSSGIKRGLATAAITALAVTGVPAIANATPISAVEGANAIDFYAPEDTTPSISAKNDGTNTSASLVVGGGVNVTSVLFQYSVATAPATFIDIAPAVARNADGVFAYDWSGIPGDVAAIRAVPNTGLVNADTQTVTNSAAAGNTVELGTEGALGVFQEPYDNADPETTGSQHLVGLRGTTSSTTPDVILTNASHGTGAPVTVTPDDADGATGSGTTGSFAARFDIGAYPYSAGSEPNQIAFNARTDNTDDAEASTLYVQIIGSITATPATQNRANPANAEVTLTVLDTQGKPVVGAQVYEKNTDTDTDGAGADTDTDGVNPTGGTNADRLIGYTDANGQLVDTSSTEAETLQYFVNTTANDAFEPAVDKSVNAVVTTYAPVNTNLVVEPVVAGRNDFDIDELQDGTPDVRATLTDQNGQPIANEPIEYSITFDPAGPTAAEAPTTYASAGNTDSNGRVTIPVNPATDARVGTYTVNVRRPNVGGAGLLQGTPFTFDANESEITWDEAPTASSTVNGSDTYTGRLALLDNMGGLGGRAVTVEYTATGDIAFSTTQPAGTTRVDGDTVTVVTAADGSFSVSLTDPAVPANVTPTAETGTLTATAAAPVKAADDAGILAADSTGSLNVVFATNTAPAGSVATIVENTAGAGKPGVLDSGTVQLRTAGGDDVPNTVVTLTVDKGFFTDGTPDPAPAAGADAGEYKSLGKTITVTTDADGNANFSTTIERDAGFDDDGLVKAVVTATVGTVTDTEDFDYDSSSPLNGGSVELVKSPEAEQSGPTDPAAVGQQVMFDLVTTDQFGNRVGGEYVNVTENKPGAQTYGGYSDFDDEGDIPVYSDRAQTVTLTATWTADTERYTTPVNGTNTVTGTETLTDTADVTFEGVDFEGSDFSISSNPEGTVKPGTTVTETVTVLDQNGNPAQGLQVEFVRSGAGGGETESRTTNANGEANYTFVASTEGTVNITAIVSDGEGQTETLTDTVTVDDGTTPPPTPVAIVAKLSGESNGAAKDKLTVSAPAIAAGAEVRLFKVINGKRIQVGNTKGLNAQGDATFIVKDTNGGQITKYVAVVVKTDKTLSDTTNPKRVR